MMRAQVDVMRRIATWVGTVTLLTACSTSGDIVVKTDLDESYVVKDSAVTEVESRADLLQHYLSEINKIKKNIAFEAKELEECVRYRGPTDYIFYAEPCRKKFPDTSKKKKSQIKAIEEKIALIGDAIDSKETRFKRFKYRAIFVDLNGNKKAMDYTLLTCLNPNLKTKEVAELSDALSLSLRYVYSKPVNSMSLKVCKKYAYKDVSTFSWRVVKN